MEPFNLQNKHLFDAAKNYGEKSDVFRYEILYRYGGTYLDTDYQCIQPLDIFHKAHYFYTGIMNAGEVLLAIGLIGSVPGHKILSATMSGITESGSKYNTINIMERTGPIHFTKIFVKIVPELTGSIVAYPVTFFYPVPNTIRGRACQAEGYKYIKPETYGVHFWECSWMRPEAFIKEGQLNYQNNVSDLGSTDLEKYLDQYFSNKRGVFVDIDCKNGITNNITHFLEKHRNWAGICIESDRHHFAQLAQNRKAFCANVKIDPHANKKQNMAGVYKFSDLLYLCKFDHVDILSLVSCNDPLYILKFIDFAKYNIKIIGINHANLEQVKSFLESQNYSLNKNFGNIYIFVK